jgi:TonB-linked SusC/RagA family outer membrane protein
MRGSFLIISTIILLTSVTWAKESSAQRVLGTMVSVKIQNKPLSEVLKQIGEMADANFIYSSQIDYEQTVSITARNEKLRVILTRLLTPLKIQFRVQDDNILILNAIDHRKTHDDSRQKANAALTDGPAAKNTVFQHLENNYLFIPPVDTTITVHGRVLDKDNAPLFNVAIQVRGTKKGTVTDETGEFTLKNVGQNQILTFISLGYFSQDVPVNGRSNIMLHLVTDTKAAALREVAVVSTGYQTLPKERATGSFDFIDNKTLNEQVGTNILNRLNGVTSGVMFNPAIGNNNKLTVRGLSTINASKEVLVVVDNFIYEGGINNINPNDVLSVTVLKDAAATSIWGARAGNGVIVITTKKGQYNHPLKVDFNTNVIVTGKPDLFYLPRISSSDYIDVEQFLYQKGFYAGAISQANLSKTPLTPAVEIFLKKASGLITATDSASQINALKSIDSRNEYNQYFYQSAVTQQYSLNLNGGKDNIAYNMGVAFDRSVSELNAPFNKLNVHFDNTYKPLKGLQVNFGIYYTNSKSISGKPSYSNQITINGKQVPYLQFADKDGTPLPVDIGLRGSYTDTAGAGKLLNWKYYPMEDYKHNISTTNLQEYLSNIGLNYQIFKDLSLDVKYQYQKQQSTQRNLADTQSYYTRNLINTYSQLNRTSGTVKYIVPLGGILSVTNNTTESHNFRVQGNYTHQWKDHHINAIAGWEIRQVQNNSDGNTLYGYTSDPLSYMEVDMVNSYPTFIGGTGVIPGLPSITQTLNRFVSYFSNIAYSWKDRYTLSLSGRKDASNIFGVSANDKWSPLWSSGLAWDISKEPFYHLTPLPYLKLRVTYGYSGNVDLSRSSVPIERISPADYSYSYYTNGRILTLNNPALQWEKIGTFNIGVDFTTGKNLLSGSIEYYHKNAFNLYGTSNYDYTSYGLSNQITKNVANMTGRGIDVSLQTKNIDRKFRWITNFLFNFNTDKITNYYSALGSIFSGTDGTSISPMAGKPVYAILSYKWGGLDVNGNPQGYLNKQLSKDYNSIINSLTSPDSLVYSGQALPKFFGSIENSFSWKGFSLIVNVTYALGYYFRKPSIDYSGLFNYGIGYGDFSRRWQKAGDELITNVPSMIYPDDTNRDNFYLLSEATVAKADNIRLRFINIAYDFSKSIIKNLPFSLITLYANASNLGILWKANKDGIDPDYPSSLKPSRSYAIGIRINF